MAPKPKSLSGLPKTETLSVRLDEKARFALDFLARLYGQSLSVVVERLAVTDATRARFTGSLNDGAFQKLWSPEPGVRELAIAALPELFPSMAEERRLLFCRTHWPYFYNDKQCTEVHLVRLSVLWSKVDDYIETFILSRSDDYLCAAKLMTADLEKAGVEPPSEITVKEIAQ